MAKSIKLPDGTYWDSKAMVHNNESLHSIITSLLEKIENSDVDSYQAGTKGYIRFTNGFQIAWISQQVTAGGTAWGNLYYSDHSLGDWSKPFATCYIATPYCNALQYWVTVGGANATSGGTLRCFRPTDMTASIWVGVVGFGKWK